MFKGHSGIGIGAALAISTVFTPGQSYAGEPAPATVSGEIAEILVTARRREESAQDIPMSIQTFSQADMELRNIASGSDLNNTVPNVVIAGGGSGQADAVMIMRGIPGVGVYLDGVWQGSRGVLQTNFVEMQRVEVLRGPQGTLFGRNTNGGAIQYVTAPPKDIFSATGEFSVGSNNRRDVKATVDIPLTDNLLTKFSAASLNSDGFIDSVATNTAGYSFGGNDDKLVRADILWKVSESFDARLTVSMADQVSSDARQTRFSNPANQHLQAYNALYTLSRTPSSELFGVPLVGGPFNAENYQPGRGVVDEWETRSNQDQNGIINDTKDYTLNLLWEINPNFSLRSITAHRQRESRQLSDWDGIEATLTFTDDRNYLDELTSQEIQLQGTLFNDRLDMLVGGYWSDEKNKFRQYRWTQAEFFEDNPANPGFARQREIRPGRTVRDAIRAYGATISNSVLANYNPLANILSPTGVNYQWTQSDVTDKAVFGELTFQALDNLSLTAGVRWSWRDDQSTIYNADPTQARFIVAPPERGGGHGPGDLYSTAAGIRTVTVLPDTGAQFTPKFSISYDVSPDVMLYGSYAEGFTQGDVSFSVFNNRFIELGPEVVKTTEVGARTEWLNRRLRFNMSYFSSKWDGLRVPILPIDPATGQQLPFPYNTDEGQAETQGVEFDTTFFLTDGLQLNLSAGWLDTEYLAVGDPASSPLRVGAPFQYAPEYSFSAGGQYRMPLASGAELTFRSDYGWIDEYQRDAAEQRQPSRPEPAYGLLSARIRYTAPSGSWSAYLAGSNLTNERYVNSGFDARNPFGLDFIGVGKSRDITAGVQFRFE